jgi:aminopeptidase N
LALDSAKVILNYYEKYFGVEYPLPKQGWWLIVEIL